MRNSAEDAGSDRSSPSERHAEEWHPAREGRNLARLRVLPGTATLRADKKGEDEMFKSTVAVSSGPPPLDAAELHTPNNIQLHEEVFVHYPSSTMNSPASLTLEGHPRSTSQGQAAAAMTSGDNAQSCSPTPQPSAQFPATSAGGSSQQGPIQHEQDHDCCPFTAIRRSEWTLRHIAKVRRTSPFDWSHLLSSFSVKNAFMFYPPPPTYCFFRDEDGAIQVRSQTGKRAPRLDHEQIEYLRRKCRLSDKVPDDLVAGALHGIACSNPPEPHGGNDGSGEDDSEPSFKLIFIPWENEVQSYYIRSGSVVFGRRVRMGHPLFTLAWPCPIPCSIIRPHRRMSSHVAIFFHCNGEDIGRPSCLRLLTLANALHMTILVPEYPGYGLFEGNPSEASIKGAMERVIEFLFSSDPGFTPSRLILMGHSIGTGVAIHVASFIKKIFIKLHNTPGLSHQVPYACPMSRCQEAAVEYAAAVRCPPNSFVVPFSAVPPTSPTVALPGGRQPAVSPLPVFTPPSAALPSNRVSPDSNDGGDHGAAEAQDSRDAAHTPLHAPYGKSGDTAKGTGPKTPQPFFCPHYALGGVILLAPFASVRCVEKWTTLRHHGFSLAELERRRLSIPEDVLVAAPEDWAEDAHELRDTGEEPPNMDFVQPSPFLFGLARYISFNRFPAIDVVRELQDDIAFFAHTPLLLLHGAQDKLVPAINSVAIASRLRQAAGGRTAKVYLGFLHDEGHNNLHCSHITRRFYKDVILMPHLRAQQELRDELEETLRNGLGRGTAAGTTNNTNNNPVNSNSNLEKPPSVQPVDSSSTSVKTISVPVHSTAATTAAAEDGEEVAEPRAFATTPRRPPVIHSPTSGTNRTTEPFDDEPPDALTLAAAVPPPCNPDTTAAATPVAGPAVAAAATANGATAAPPDAPEMSLQPTDPCLYFLEPAYTEDGATWLAKGNLAGPLRIRLLHPPQQRNLMTEVSPKISHTHEAPPPRDANVFVTHHTDPAWWQWNRSRKRHGSRKPPTASSPPPQRTGERGDGRRCNGKVCHVSEQFEDSLRDTLRRTQPPNVNFAPAATMLHIALFHHLDHYDVGSLAVASVTKYSVDAAVALRQWRNYRRNHFILRCIIAFFYFAAGSFFISLAICHGVLTHPSKLRPYLPPGASTERYHRDARVIIWGVLDGTGFFLLGIVRFFHTRLGLGNLSKYMHTPSSVLGVYAACRILAYLLCAAAGIFMAMIIALTPPHRGGVDWGRWSDLPYSRRVWISYLPRWAMVTSASIHMFFLIAIFLKNH